MVGPEAGLPLPWCLPLPQRLAPLLILTPSHPLPFWTLAAADSDFAAPGTRLGLQACLRPISSCRSLSKSHLLFGPPAMAHAANCLSTGQVSKREDD